ncbi:sensor histidine kinase [Geothermobacter hydrogeniphilus]|uniref:histidine kinase n=1 Tax=Geothermobacter hydrogeniphilus TaxID=1969733 RepID=A0A2K2H8Q2_9BACT|nr:ATP-binding protein [Geothermobacter hydrogeniphilus]PNU19647.1 sensor histidine kinase [Geothermobacter hydrogeniphilus]
MRANHLLRLCVLFVLVGAVTALHYTTNTSLDEFHDIYRRLYYLPIVLGGIWYAIRGGVATSLLISILYAPHVIFQWGHHPATNLEQYLEILLYNAIGLLTGVLSAREQAQSMRYRKTAERLEESYSRLREQADQLLEVEEQLRRADRLSALGELSAGLAHEIRNPLGSIRGTAEILRDGIPADSPHQEFAAILIKEVDRLNQVVQDFLDFARPGKIEAGRVDLNQMVDEVLALSGRMLQKSRTELQVDKASIPCCRGNAEQLKQALLNLVLNAMQAMPDGGILRVTTGQKGNQLFIAVSDSGQGISAEMQNRIFDPFFTTRHEGTGLGLAISGRIVRGHGGRIDVNSEPGQGATFTLSLPCSESME